MAQYYCEHCGKKFDAPETIVQRCPSCFWTTSVHLVGEPDSPKKVDLTKDIKPPLPKLKSPNISPKIFKIITALVIIIAAVWVLKSIVQQTSGIVDNVKTRLSEEDKPKPDVQKTPVSEMPAEPVLSDAEAQILAREVKLEIPRPFGQDELQIFNQRVDFPFQTEKPQLSKMWTQDDFEAFLVKQQKARGIYFSWGYERKLIQLFKEHYLKAGEALAKNDYETARYEFIQSLVFPVYSNNPLHHKAVALVMLQPYINDVLGKIHQLNMHLLMARVRNSMQPVETKYGTLFDLVKDNKIEEAFQLAESLERDIELTNNVAKQVQIDYPPEVAQIDSDIRRGIDIQDELLEPVSVKLTSVAADLRIKKKVLSQNLPASLRVIQEEYSKAIAAIRDKKWQEALLALEKVQFPPELADDARQKEAVIKKLI